MALSGADSALSPFTLFDPSYGKRYSSPGATSFLAAEQAWETTSLQNIVYLLPSGLPFVRLMTNAIIMASSPCSFQTLSGANL